MISRMRQLVRKLANVLQRTGAERELTREVASHLALIQDELERRGMSPEDARAAARRKFGGVEQAKERHRDERSFVWLDALSSDLRFAVRSLARRPGFAAVAVMTLALGIGACTVVFSGINALFLRPLPYRDPQQLVWAWGRFSGGNMASVSPADFLDYRAQNRSFSEFAAWTGAPPLTLVDAPQPMQLSVAAVSGNFFDVFGVSPLRGRTLGLDDENVRVPAVVVLSQGLWQTLFGAREDIIGDTLRFAGSPGGMTIVGVMPAELRFPNLPDPPDVWVPIPFADPGRRSRSAHNLRPIGRLNQGVSLTQAQREMDVIAGRLEQVYPDTNAGFGLRLVPLGRQFDTFLQEPLIALSAAVALLLLIACSNVANLVLARGAARQRELATRVALGAGRSRLIRLLMSEAAILALAGGAIGVMMAFWVTNLVRSLPPLGGVLRLSGVSVDLQALVFASVVAMFTVLIVGLVPALRTTSRSALQGVRSGSGTLGGRGRNLPSSGLVVFEVAMSLVLLVGAGLALRSFLKLATVDPGFNPSGVVTVPIRPPGLEEPESRRSYFVELLNQVESVPGMEASALVSGRVFQPVEDWYFELEGRPFTSTAKRPTAFYEQVSAEYFRAMGIPLRRGRSFTRDEVYQKAPVAIVDERLVEMFLPGQDPLGKRIVVFVNPQEKTSYEIIAVAGSVLPAPGVGLYQTIYVPDVQSSVTMTLVVRAAGSAGAVVNPLRDTLRRMDKNLPLSQITPMADVVTESLSGRRTATTVLSVFSGIGLGLAGIGLYGILAFSTARRTNEIGLRMALGSSQGDVLWLIISEGMKLSVVGLAFGLAGAYAFSLILSGVLVGTPSVDPVAFLTAPLVLAGVALCASYVPARRAASIDPARALRHD